MAKRAHQADVSPVKMCMGGRTPAPARTAPRPARSGGAQAQQGRLAAWGCGRGDFDWAAGIVHSRCFATRVGGRAVRLAVPGVDMCNHAAEPSAHVRCGAARARPPDAARKPCEDSSGEAVFVPTCESLPGGRGRVQHSPEAVQGLAAAAEVCEPAPAQPSRFELVAGPEGIRRAGPGRARPSLWSRASISRRPAAKAERGCFFHCQVDQAPCLALQSQASSLLVRACSSACREHGRSRRAAAGGRRARCARAAWPPWPPWQPWRLTLYP